MRVTKNNLNKQAFQHLSYSSLSMFLVTGINGKKGVNGEPTTGVSKPSLDTRSEAHSMHLLFQQI